MKRILYIAAAIVLAPCSKSTAEQLAEAAKTLQCSALEVLTVLNDTVRAQNRCKLSRRLFQQECPGGGNPLCGI